MLRVHVCTRARAAEGEKWQPRVNVGARSHVTRRPLANWFPSSGPTGSREERRSHHTLQLQPPPSLSHHHSITHLLLSIPLSIHSLSLLPSSIPIASLLIPSPLLTPSFLHRSLIPSSSFFSSPLYLTSPHRSSLLHITPSIRHPTTFEGRSHKNKHLEKQTKPEKNPPKTLRLISWRFVNFDLNNPNNLRLYVTEMSDYSLKSQRRH